ncbi:MAG: 4Fe-4S cluster-binding domain-containing protein, partial [Nannocystaceae bacterium]|nr:4Fe-4S cluster-binding domain-containing protein [Nannocystaceae bacterium]
TGEAEDIETLLAEIDAVRDEIEGITVLGGEPLEQLAPVAQLAAAMAVRGLGVLVSTGLTFTEARAKPGFEGLWRSIDTLVTGRFMAKHPEPRGGRAFIGSSNQRLMHRTTRYRDPRLWLGPPRAEVVLDAQGGAIVLGAPALVATVRRRLAAS